MAAQTTQNLQEWKKSQEILKKYCTNTKIFDTICSVTEKRQTEAENLCKSTEVMLVIGGKDSSNTAKLYQICKNHCPKTFWIQTKDDIPFEKIGLMDESDYTLNAKTKAISPVNTTDTAVSKQDLTLQWETVDGAQQYYVELAKDENFTDILEVTTTFELSYKVISDLKADEVYYWRVTTIPKAMCSTGSQLTSDVFAFKIAQTGKNIERNQVGVTSYLVDDMTKDNFKVTTYVYNLKDDSANANIYVACYNDENKLVEVMSEPVTIPAKTKVFVIHQFYRLYTTKEKMNGKSFWK